MDTQQVAMEEL